LLAHREKGKREKGRGKRVGGGVDGRGGRLGFGGD
jgi:hypothetical protein